MGLLEWLTDCGPASPTMAISREEAKSPIVVQSIVLDILLVFSKCWDPEEESSNTSERMPQQQDKLTGQ